MTRRGGGAATLAPRERDRCYGLADRKQDHRERRGRAGADLTLGSESHARTYPTAFVLAHTPACHQLLRRDRAVERARGSRARGRRGLARLELRHGRDRELGFRYPVLWHH